MNYSIFDVGFRRLLEISNYQLLTPIYFTKITQYTYATSVYSSQIEHPWYNHFYIPQDKLYCTKNTDISKILCNTYLSSKKRKNCIYIPEELEWLHIHLQSPKFLFFEKEHWWYFNTRLDLQRKMNNDVNIVQISHANFEDFVKVFNVCFNLKANHINCWRNVFINSTSLQYIGFMAYKDLIPVGIMWLATNKKFCGIYMVATIPEYRRQGIFTTLFMQVMHYCHIHKIQHILLQSVSTDECNAIYKRIGFINIFTRIGYLSI